MSLKVHVAGILSQAQIFVAYSVLHADANALQTYRHTVKIPQTSILPMGV